MQVVANLNCMDIQLLWNHGEPIYLLELQKLQINSHTDVQEAEARDTSTSLRLTILKNKIAVQGHGAQPTMVVTTGLMALDTSERILELQRAGQFGKLVLHFEHLTADLHTQVN